MLSRVTFDLGFRKLCASFDKLYKSEKATEYYESLARLVEDGDWSAVVDQGKSAGDSFPSIKTLQAIVFKMRRERTPPPLAARNMDLCGECGATRIGIYYRNQNGRECCRLAIPHHPECQSSDAQNERKMAQLYCWEVLV